MAIATAVTSSSDRLLPSQLSALLGTGCHGIRSEKAARLAILPLDTRTFKPTKHRKKTNKGYVLSCMQQWQSSTSTRLVRVFRMVLSTHQRSSPCSSARRRKDGRVVLVSADGRFNCVQVVFCFCLLRESCVYPVSQWGARRPHHFGGKEMAEMSMLAVGLEVAVIPSFSIPRTLPKLWSSRIQRKRYLEGSRQPCGPTFGNKPSSTQCRASHKIDDR